VAKEKMNVEFERNQLRPHDPNYVWDKQEEFHAEEPSEWDEEEEEEEDDDDEAS